MNNHHKTISPNVLPPKIWEDFFEKKAFRSYSGEGRLGYLFSLGNPDTEL